MKEPVGVKVYRVRGRTYAYHRRTRIRLYSEPATAAFLTELAIIEQRHLRLDKPSFPPGSIGREIIAFTKTDRFLLLPLRIRSNIRDIVLVLGAHARSPLQQVDRRTVIKLRDWIHRRFGRSRANTFVIVLGEVLAHAALRRALTHNPVDLTCLLPHPKPPLSSDRRRR